MYFCDDLLHHKIFLWFIKNWMFNVGHCFDQALNSVQCLNSIVSNKTCSTCLQWNKLIFCFQKPNMTSLCPKDEFFNVLNLVATKKVKVKYCRTIKERLRAKTQEESLTPTSKPRSPVKRKAEDVKTPPSSPEKATKVELKGSLCYLQSYKNKKKAKIKERPSTSPPSSKSLLR